MLLKVEDVAAGRKPRKHRRLTNRFVPSRGRSLYFVHPENMVGLCAFDGRIFVCEPACLLLTVVIRDHAKFQRVFVLSLI